MAKQKPKIGLGGNLQTINATASLQTFYQQYYGRIKELSMVMFDWQGVPETVDIAFLEKTLFLHGKAVFFKDEALGHLALKCATEGGLNVYGIPKYRRAYADNGYQNRLTEADSVVIWNNYLHGNSATDAQVFARRLANIDVAIDINVHAQRTPILIRCSEQQRLTLMNMYAKYSGGEPFIFGDNNLDINSMTVFTTGAPYVVDKLREEKNQVWNEMLTYLGISNTNITKRERLVTDEVIRGQGGTIASRYSRLQMRRMACEEINKMFGLHMDCDYREDYREIAGIETMPTESEGGGE